jgi:hypothetical protein
MSYPDAGFVWADRIGGTTYLVLCVFVLSLDSCDCTGFFHRTALTLCYSGMVVGAFMATFVWPDVIIGKGIQTAAGLDPDLMFTKNGFLSISPLSLGPALYKLTRLSLTSVLNLAESCIL